MDVNEHERPSNYTL